MTLLAEVVVGSTRRNLVFYAVDRTTGQPTNVTGGTFTLQGESEDLPTHDINQAGVVTDGPNGQVTWAGIGAYVASSDLAGKDRARYTLRIKFVDAATKIDFSDAFEIDWVALPI